MQTAAMKISQPAVLSPHVEAAWSGVDMKVSKKLLLLLLLLLDRLSARQRAGSVLINIAAPSWSYCW